MNTQAEQSIARTKEPKRRQGLHSRAHVWASRHVKDAPDGWSEGEKNTYWWGLFDGFKAGIEAERKKK